LISDLPAANGHRVAEANKLEPGVKVAPRFRLRIVINDTLVKGFAI
jgi:hypothetical protein